MRDHKETILKNRENILMTFKEPQGQFQQNLADYPQMKRIQGFYTILKKGDNDLTNVII